MAPPVGTVVKIKQTADGWKPVKEAVEITANKAARPTVVARSAAQKPVARTASSGALRPVSSLVALAKQRSQCNELEEGEEEEEEEEEWDDVPEENEEEADWVESEGTSKTKHGSGAPVKRKAGENKKSKDKWSEEWNEEWNDEWDEEGGDEWEEQKAPKKARSDKQGTSATGHGKLPKGFTGMMKPGVNLNLKMSHSGVVRSRDGKGNLLIDCAPVTGAFGAQAVIPEDDNAMGARVGSIVCFHVKPRKGLHPLAKNVVINGFEEIDGAEALPWEDDEDEEEEQGKKGGKKGKRSFINQGGKKGKAGKVGKGATAATKGCGKAAGKMAFSKGSSSGKGQCGKTNKGSGGKLSGKSPMLAAKGKGRMKGGSW